MSNKRPLCDADIEEVLAEVRAIRAQRALALAPAGPALAQAAAPAPAPALALAQAAAAAPATNPEPAAKRAKSVPDGKKKKKAKVATPRRYQVFCNDGNGALVTLLIPAAGLSAEHERELVAAAELYKERLLQPCTVPAGPAEPAALDVGGGVIFEVRAVFSKMFAALLYEWLSIDLLPELPACVASASAGPSVLALKFCKWDQDEAGICDTAEFAECDELMAKACA